MMACYEYQYYSKVHKINCYDVKLIYFDMLREAAQNIRYLMGV